MMIYVTTCHSAGGTCSSVVIFNGFLLVQIFAASRRKDGNQRYSER